MDWGRLVFGPPGRGLGRARWPFTALMALVAAVLLAYVGDWLWATVFFVVAALLGALTLRSMR